VEPGCGIDEKHGVVDVVFLAEFCEKHLGDCLISRWKQPTVEDSVRRGIESCIQPVALIVELDHGLVGSDVIRTDTTGWL
jgi:hypothetical protein